MARKSTRGAQGSGTIRKKTVKRNGQEYAYWEARITIGRDPGTGKQIQKSFSGKTQKEVREKMQAAAVAVNDGSYQEPSKMTAGEWLDIWVRDYLNDVKPFAAVSYKGQIENHIKPALGAVKLDNLAPHTIQRFYNDLGKPKEKKRKDETVEEMPGLSPKSIEMSTGYSTRLCSRPLKISISVLIPPMSVSCHG